MNPVTVLTLGPGSRDYLTLGALNTLKNAKKLILRTGESDCAQYLRESGIAFETLDCFYEQAEDFDEVISMCVSRVQEAAQTEDVVYAVADPEQDETVRALIEKGIAGRIIPGVSQAAEALAASGCPSVYRCAASSLPDSLGDFPLLIEEIDDALLAGDIKLRLLSVYGNSQTVRFYPPETPGQGRRYITIPLEELDRQESYGQSCCALILPLPLLKKERYTVQDLVKVMSILQGPGGCPWDLSQDHRSLRPYLIEEAYETAAAIDEEDWLHVAEELGDVLLQVVFQADIGRQYGTFELSDVTTAICRKMIERHPHIFADTSADTAEQVTENWEAIKRRQRGLKTLKEVLEDLPRTLPPLMKAEKIQKKAELSGADVGDAETSVRKIRDLSALLLSGSQDEETLEQTAGELLFACVNLLRLSHTEAETALQAANERFIAKFS